jgi:hypothetical protein
MIHYEDFALSPPFFISSLTEEVHDHDIRVALGPGPLHLRDALPPPNVPQHLCVRACVRWCLRVFCVAVE